MKLSVTLSSMLHIAAISWALVSVSGPSPLVTVQEQGVEVDFAVDSAAEAGRGEERAEVDPVPTPQPTERAQKIPDAVNVGDANEDSPSREGIVNERTLDTVKTSAAPQAEEANNSPVVKENPVIEGEVADTPVPTNEVASLNEPKVPVPDDAPDDGLAPAEADVTEPTEVQDVPIPVRAPANRPKPKSPQTTQRQTPDEIRPQRTAASTEDQKEITDRIGNLLNTAEDTAGGARRQERVASIGADSTRNAPRLTRGEYDALKGRIRQCWILPNSVVTEDLEVFVRLEIGRDGYVADISDMQVTGAVNTAQDGMVKSSLRLRLDPRNCQLTDVLPSEKYETWRVVEINFKPRDF